MTIEGLSALSTFASEVHMQLVRSSTASVHVFVLSDLVSSVNVAWVFSTNFIFRGKKMLHVHRKCSVLVLSNLMEGLTNKEHDNRRSFLLRWWLVLRWRFRKLQMAEF
jgi:hypothetical protein